MGHEISDIPPNHQLKTVRPFFADVWDELKTFEIRKNDRDFKVGDILWLEEYLAALERYTNKVIVARVEYILTHEQFPQGLQEGYVCMSIKILEKISVNTFC